MEMEGKPVDFLNFFWILRLDSRSWFNLNHELSNKLGKNPLIRKENYEDKS